MTTFFKIDKDVYASYLDKKEADITNHITRIEHKFIVEGFFEFLLNIISGTHRLELSLYEVELKRVQRLRVALSVSTSTYVIVTDSEAEDIAKLLYDNS